METQWQHIHLGAGRLGLGLIVPTMRAEGLDTTTILNRSPKSVAGEQRYASLRALRSYATDCRGQTEAVYGIDLYLDYEADQIPLDPTRGVLLTTAVGVASLADTADSISRIIDRWCAFDFGPEHPVFYAVACENKDFASSYLEQMIMARSPSLRSARYDVRFLNSVVDRVCLDPRIHNGIVYVPVEPYVSWVVEVRPSHREDRPPPFQKAPWIRIVDDIIPWQSRKKWLMNGIHLALATLCQTEKDPPVDFLDEGVRDIGIRALVENAQMEMIEALLLEYPGNWDRKELESYAEEILRRLEETHDPVRRIFHDIDSNAFGELYEKIGERIAKPLGVLRAAGRPYTALLACFTRISNYVPSRA